MDQAEIGKLYRLQTGESAKLLQKKPGGWKEFLIVTAGSLGVEAGEIYTSRVKEDLLVELNSDGFPAVVMQVAVTNGHGSEKSRGSSAAVAKRKTAQGKYKGTGGLSNGVGGRRHGNGKHKGLSRRGSSESRARPSDSLRNSSPSVNIAPNRSLQSLVDVCHHVMEFEDSPSLVARHLAATSMPVLSRSFESIATIGTDLPRSPFLGFAANPPMNGRQASVSPLVTFSENNSELPPLDVTMTDAPDAAVVTPGFQKKAIKIYLTDLPNAVLFKILSYLPLASLSQVEATSSTMQGLASDVWKSLVANVGAKSPLPLEHFYSPTRDPVLARNFWKVKFMSEVLTWTCAHCGASFTGQTNRLGSCQIMVWGIVPMRNTQTHSRPAGHVLRLAATPAVDIPSLVETSSLP